MKLPSILLLASTALVQCALEIGINKLQPGQHGLTKRATYAEDLANNITGGGYYAQVSVGNPPQQQTMVLDTGSSDVWVVAYNADLCRSARLQQYYQDTCSQTYQPSRSSSYKLIDSREFSISYLDGSGSGGDYIADDFTIGGTTIKSLQMGYATQTVRGIGIMGVGFSNHEAADVQYPNIMDQFVAQKIISVKAFSLYLNDRRSKSGTVLFGGMDTNKFIGTLNVVPIIKDFQTNTISTFTVGLSGLSASFPNGTSAKITLPETSVPALLDSGTTLSYIPESMATDLYSQIGAYTDVRQTGLTFVDCNFLNADAGLDINFSFAGGPTIRVPVNEMVIEVFEGYSTIPRGIPFDNPCLFGIQSTGGFSTQSQSLSSSNFVLLGDTFLRSAYVVYDITHQQIGLAQANLNSTESNVVEFQASNSGIPSATGVASQVANTGVPTPTGGGSGGGGGSGTNSASPSPSNGAVASVRPLDGGFWAVVALTGIFALVGMAI